MRKAGLLKTIMAFLVCLALIRAVNNAGGLSVTDILVEVQNFKFDTSKITELLDLFKEGNLTSGLVGWNRELTGIDGFFANMANVLTSFFDMIWRLINSIFNAAWFTTVEIFRIFGKIFNLTMKLTGIK